MTPFYLNTASTLIFNNTLSAQGFSAFIGRPYAVRWQKRVYVPLTYLDSFDGRLYRAGYTLILTGQRIFVRGKGRTLSDIWSNTHLPLQPADFNNIPMQKLLNEILDARRLIKILSLKISHKPFSILNFDLKTVARGFFINYKSLYPHPGKGKTILFLKPLRGYQADVNNLLQPLPLHNRYINFTQAVFTESGIELKDYSKPVYDFKEKENLSQALYEILYKNFIILLKNEKGLAADIDIEFLHDYRVACRRMRSAVSLIKEILQPLSLKMLKVDLKLLNKYSGPLRDLDVYLLREEEYKALLPAEWPQQDIHAIFIRLKSQRKRAFNNMIKMLRTNEYQTLIKRWETFFNDFNTHVKSDAPLLKTASALIMKWFNRIIKQGRILKAEDPDEKFHDLRITCKKLRYLLEFFATLYPEALTSKALKQLKKLQTNLGEFNDYSVQIDTLNQLLKRSVKPSTSFIKTVAGLITVLDYKMHQLKNEFFILFEDFASNNNIKLYIKIFGNIT